MKDIYGGFLFAVFSIFTTTNPLLAQLVQTSGLSGLALPGPVAVPTAATFTVNSTADGSDFFPGNGICATSPIPPFICTLRAAIQEANASPGLDVINFSIGTGVQTITPASPLPTITDPVIIDGTTQPSVVPGIPCIVSGHPCIELNGSSVSMFFAAGLRITGGNSTVRGLVINRFSSAGSKGIVLETGGGNIIQRNFIGTNVTGTGVLGNGIDGVFISSPDNTIGGTTAAARNVISGNILYGVRFDGVSATGNQVLGNFIGTDVTGTLDLGNSYDGVLIYGSPNNTIGGTTAGARNVISGNDQSGVVISQVSATGNQVQGNFIGTDVTGTVDLGNLVGGVLINGSPNNTIGGTTAGERNVISGNNQSGVEILIGDGNQVLGNFIGTDVTGTAVLGNGLEGVFISSPNNTIGGMTAAAGNVISGNSRTGVWILSGDGNQVLGNFIGTDASGMVDLGNSEDGVRIEGSSNTIGGTTAGARNVISGNNGDGVQLDQFAVVTQVLGNFIGTDVNGTVDLGNSQDGVFINSSSNNTIGGTTAAARNIISGNDQSGVEILVGDGNKVLGNFIGTDVTGTLDLGNVLDGVFINSSPNNLIGGMASGAGNTIAFNGGDGVLVDFGFLPTTGNTILGNSVFSNDSIGIDLSPTNWVTPNDLGDGDAGANNLQNFPVLTSADSVGANTTILGTFNSTANDSFRLEFFANNSCDTSGYGEGQTFIGSTNVLTDGSGNAKIHITFPVAVPGGKFITATATDTAGNTSEFSQCRIVEGTTSVGTLEEVPQVFALYQNYPNPFNPSTTISFDIPYRTRATLAVYNLLGQHVATLVDEEREAGKYRVEWNAGSIASGVYFYRLQGGGFVSTKKLILLR